MSDPSIPQMTFKNMKIPYQAEEIPRNLPYGKPKMGCLRSIIMSNAMEISIYDENIKRNKEPLCGKKHLYQYRSRNA
jgi:hypothetical protein